MARRRSDRGGGKLGWGGLWTLLWLVSWGWHTQAQLGRPAALPPPLAPLAQQPSERGARFVQNYGQDEFQSLPQMWHIAQDAQGVLYFANDAGLVIYDGARWQRLTMPNSATVRSVAIAPDNRVYIGAENEFGYLTATPNGTAQFVSLLERIPPAKRRFGSVWRTWATPEGMFFQSYRYLFHLVGEDVHVHEPDGSVARDDFVWSHWIAGRLYVHQRHVGLLQLGNDEVLRLALGGEHFAERRVCALLPFDATHLLAVTQEDGLRLYQPATGEITDFPLTPRLERPLDINHACLLADGRIALGSNHVGVVICDREGRIGEVIGRQAGLGSPSVHWVYSDHQGGLWAAHRNGVARIEACSPLSYFDESNGLEGRVFALHRHAGRLYAGTLGGLFELTTTFPTAPVRGQARFVRVVGLNDDCWHMVTHGPDMLVAGGGGLYVIALGKDGVSQVKKLDFEGRAYAFCQDPVRPERVYVGARRGLHRLTRRGPDWTMEMNLFGIQDEVRSLVVTDDGLWCGTMHQGAWLVPTDALQSNRQSDATPAFRIDDRIGLPTQRETFVASVNGKACLATQRGVYVFDPQRRSLALASDFSALGEVPVFRIGADAAGDLWYAKDFAERGRLRPGQDGKPQVDAQVLRLPPAGLLRAIRCEADGVVWLGGDKGLFRYEPTAAQPFGNQGHTLLRRLEAGNGQALFAGYGDVPSGPLVIPYESNRLRCEVALTAFPRERQHLFRFRLDGSDRQWSAWSTETVKEYTNLREGIYTLQVEAQDLYGRLQAAVPVRIRILPPWYRTWWAYTLATVVLGGLAVAGVRFRERILVQRNRALERLVSERTSEITRQRDEILDSIRYAERIQKAVLPTPADLRRYVPESFVLYEPRDIVSGDFYWVQPVEDGIIVVVGDCTGHGVPGAFMSLISNDLLNQIVIERGITDPAALLNELDAGIIAALSQGVGDGIGRVDDGLDAGIVCLDQRRQRLRYAGARRPLYIAHDGVLTEIKGDLRSVGGSRRERRFTGHEVQLEVGAMLYLATDGFADQNDGQGKKYGTRRFKSLLCALCHHPVAEQRERLQQALREHAGTERLRDDVTIVGIRL
ncbi:MAG: SpoIIE family protein phosphatase [Chloracidobacterium sp.]